MVLWSEGHLDKNLNKLACHLCFDQEALSRPTAGLGIRLPRRKLSRSLTESNTPLPIDAHDQDGMRSRVSGYRPTCSHATCFSNMFFSTPKNSTLDVALDLAACIGTIVIYARYDIGIQENSSQKTMPSQRPFAKGSQDNRHYITSNAMRLIEGCQRGTMGAKISLAAGSRLDLDHLTQTDKCQPAT